jgi:hypothetical protein
MHEPAMCACADPPAGLLDPLCYPGLLDHLFHPKACCASAQLQLQVVLCMP